MNDDIKKVKEERTQIKHDVYDNKIPKRVPINVSLGLTVIADYGKIDRKQAYWNPALLEKAAEELSELIPSDIGLFRGSVYTPTTAQALGSRNRIMSAAGFMQHPNTMAMEEDEYDELIADPYAFVVDKCLPRIYENLDIVNNPARSLFALAQEKYMGQQTQKILAPVTKRLDEKFGYPDSEGRGGGGRAPMDWVADQLRSFSGICIDVRRQRSKLIEALDAIYPMLYKRALAPNLKKINRYAPASFQLHMATYLREKDFAEVWLPSWARMLNDFSSLGMRCGAFLEHDWTHLLDYLQDLPTGSYFTFEFTDPKKLKDKLGKKFVLGGGYPLKNLTDYTKEEVIDKTKEWLDIMAPGGQYIFGFDKSALTLADINLENLIAVCETVRDYGVYDNPGAPTGEVFNKENYEHSDVPEFTSKYYRTWEQYLQKYPNTPESAKDMVMAAEDMIFDSVLSLSY